MNSYTVSFEGHLIIQALDEDHAKQLADEILEEVSTEYAVLEVTE